MKCTHVTGIESRKKADQDLYEHWNLYHKAEYNDMQSEADTQRLIREQKSEMDLEQQKVNRKMEMENLYLRQELGNKLYFKESLQGQPPRKKWKMLD